MPGSVFPSALVIATSPGSRNFDLYYYCQNAAASSDVTVVSGP